MAIVDGAAQEKVSWSLLNDILYLTSLCIV